MLGKSVYIDMSELSYSLEMASDPYLSPTFLLMPPEKQRKRYTQKTVIDIQPIA